MPRDEDTATLPRTARRRGPKKVRRAVGKVRRGVLRLGDIEGEGSVIVLAAGGERPTRP